ncbi:MAG: SAM-dependent methyltransferase [Thermomicrobiales bacterium]|nr:SAM-dependent methyltransferase [Thermomicrobiales bacterium]
MKSWFRVQSIGTVIRPDDPGGDSGYFDPSHPSVIEIDDRWIDGLSGIEDYSHLVVLFYLDRAPRRRSTGQLLPAEGSEALPSVGFFSTRTPKRPNPIGISCPRLIRRERNRLTVVGFDAWHGTPVLDIKGYSPRDELRPDWTVPAWLETLWATHDAQRPDGLRLWEEER